MVVSGSILRVRPVRSVRPVSPGLRSRRKRRRRVSVCRPLVEPPQASYKYTGSFSIDSSTDTSLRASDVAGPLDQPELHVDQAQTSQSEIHRVGRRTLEGRGEGCTWNTRRATGSTP